MTKIKLSDARPFDNETFYIPYVIVYVLYFILWPARYVSLIPLILFTLLALSMIALEVLARDDVGPQDRVLLALLQLGYLFILMLPATLLYLWHWKYI